MGKVKKSVFERNRLIYLTAIIISVISYYFLTQNIRLTLFPYKALIAFLYNMDFSFIENLGYMQSESLFAISKSCLGVNLFLSLFLILIFGFYKKFKFIKNHVLRFSFFYFLALILAFVLTVIRISASVPFCRFDSFVLIHNIISLSIYFFSAMVLYYIMERVTK